MPHARLLVIHKKARVVAPSASAWIQILPCVPTRTLIGRGGTFLCEQFAAHRNFLSQQCTKDQSICASSALVCRKFWFAVWHPPRNEKFPSSQNLLHQLKFIVPYRFVRLFKRTRHQNYLLRRFHPTTDGIAADVQLFGYAGGLFRLISHCFLNWKITCPVRTKPENSWIFLFCFNILWFSPSSSVFLSSISVYMMWFSDESAVRIGYSYVPITNIICQNTLYNTSLSFVFE